MKINKTLILEMIGPSAAPIVPMNSGSIDITSNFHRTPTLTKTSKLKRIKHGRYPKYSE